MSFGTVLLAGGAKGVRYALPNSTIHIHQPWQAQGRGGQASDIEIEAREILRLRSKLNDILARHTGQPLERIQRDTDRDYFMTAQQALEYGIIDGIISEGSEEAPGGGTQPITQEPSESKPPEAA
jgi:ATP-dependent Clp protease protease subunit